jgi:CRP/FNR family transcriptional regulator
MERYFELMTIINELTIKNLDYKIRKLLKLRSQNNTNKIVKLTHIEIAQITGTSRVVVSRILKKLEHKISIPRGEVEL